jgi:hypothetical protein
MLQPPLPEDTSVTRYDFGECAMSKAVQDICDERERQVTQEGWTREHDDSHSSGEMADAAGCYCLFGESPHVPGLWPWEESWWKPQEKRRNLVRAAALIVAELERMDRAEYAKRKEHA